MTLIVHLAKFALLLFLKLPPYQASIHDFCNPTTYYSKEASNCVRCQQKCSHGQGLTQNCGHYKGEPACKDCPANHYSKLEYVGQNHEGHYMCKPCKQCKKSRRRKDGQQFKRTCTRFADAVCMDCPPGYYDGEKHGTEGCFKCGPCCGRSPDTRDECKHIGLGAMCSCPERTWSQCSLNLKMVKVCQAKIISLTRGKHATTASHPITTQSTTTTTMPTTASTTTTIMAASTAMKSIRDSELQTSTKHSTIKSSPTTINVSPKINTTLRQKKDIIPSKTKAPMSTVLKNNSNHSTLASTTNKQPNARNAFPLVSTKTTSPRDTIHSKYKLKERYYLGAVAAIVFILVLVILIIKCKNKHKKHRPCDDPSVSILSTVEVTGEQETGYVEGTAKETSRKELVNTAVPFECSDEQGDCEDEPWIPMIVATIDTKKQSHVIIKGAKQSCFTGERTRRGVSKDVDKERHATIDARKQSHVMIKGAKQSCFTGERLYRGISIEEDMTCHGTIDAKKQSQVMVKDTTQSCTNSESIHRGISQEEDVQRHGVMYRGCRHNCVIHFCNLTKDETCDKKVEELRGCQRTYLIKKLDVEIAGVSSWKELAQVVGVDDTTIDNWKGNFKAGFSPTESLIHHMISRNTLVSNLLNHLDTIERFDIRDTLREHLENKCDLCRRRSGEASLV